MVDTLEILHSYTDGNRPPTPGVEGNPYVNFAENQYGVIDNTGNHDLLAVRIFNILSSYQIGDYATYNGQLYRAIVAIQPGAFDPGEWDQITTLSQLNAVNGVIPSVMSPANPNNGCAWWSINDAQLYIYNGAQWVIAVNVPIPNISSLLQTALNAGGQTINTPAITGGTQAQPTINQPVIMGVTDGSSAQPGEVGEVISASASNVNVAGQSVYTTITTLQLTPGDWDVYGNVAIAFVAASGVTLVAAQLLPSTSIAAATVWLPMASLSGTWSFVLSVSGLRMNIAQPGSVALQFATGWAGATSIYGSGTVWARRAR